LTPLEDPSKSSTPGLPLRLRDAAYLTLDIDGAVPDGNGRVVVLGGGVTGEHFVGALRRLDDDVPITVVERLLVGGECSYWACMPTKTMLRPPDALSAARRVPGATEAVTGEVDTSALFAFRDWMTSGWDDSGQVDWLASENIDFVRGEARVAGPGRLAVGDRELEFAKLVIATGSVPIIPPIPGLDEVEYWTNRGATETSEVPESVVVLGAGAVGVELAQFFRRVGSRVTLVVRGDRLIPRVDARAAELLLDAFREEGIDVRLESEVERVEPGIRVHLSGGDPVETEQLLVATGRRPNVEGYGFEQLGVTVGNKGIEVDETLRAADDVWAIGDATGVALFTHNGKYQARVAAKNVVGGSARADYRAIPATIFTDPQIASVGRTDGDGVVTAEYDLTTVPRAYTYEKPARPGFVKVAADRERRVLVGAVAAGPESGEWLQQLTLAVRAEVPVDVVLDTIQPYPTFSEAVFFAVQELEV
jgi:pyruvate/2-oxoglutarate dehydrogenase complex dihydrolipoamide dehydrogenase (E3) component